MSDRVVRFVLENSGDGSCRVSFEPEGAEVLLDAGGQLTVEIHGEGEGDSMELNHYSDGIAVWAIGRTRTLVWDSSGQRVHV